MIRWPLLLAGSAFALAAGAAIATGVVWSKPEAASAVVSVPAATAQIVRGPLLDTKTISGTLSYGDLASLRPTLAEDKGIVTWIAPTGSTVDRGEPLYAIDGRPTVLFYGSVPHHRTLRFEPGATEPVWVELETAEAKVATAELTLVLEQERLSDAQARVSDTALRLDDALSGDPATAEFLELKGAVSAAEAKFARVAELSAAELAATSEVEGAEAGLSAARARFEDAIRNLRREAANARLDAVSARLAVSQAQADLEALRTSLAALEAEAADGADIAQLAENLAALGFEGSLTEQVMRWQQDAGLPATGIIDPSQLLVAPGPIHVAAHDASPGETLTAASLDRTSILQYSSTDKLVTVPLGVADRALAEPGHPVTVILPDDRELEGTISEVGTVVTDGTVEITVTIADQAALGALEIASVDIEFVSDRRDDVLSVPVTALLARPEGGFAVELVAGGDTKLVPVDTGLFAAGRVEVTGDGIAEGMLVGVPA